METQAMSGGMVILDALVDGLRLSDLALNDKIMRALCAIGPQALPFLNIAVNQTKSVPPRRRILDAIDLIEDIGGQDNRVGFHVWRALLDCLRVTNPQLNRKATEALSQLPGEFVLKLESEAVYERRRKGYADRLTYAAMRLGQRTPK